MYWREFCAGVDEVGRGPLAGAVVAAAVVLDTFHTIPGLRDSKALSEKKREVLDLEIKEKAQGFCIARAEVEEIDEINILQASLLAMQRAVAGLNGQVDFVVVDGNRTPTFACPSEWLIKGDSKFDAIKAASIIAKVTRDRIMFQYGKIFPEYGFEQNSGYGTKVHMEALYKYKSTPIHRRTHVLSAHLRL